MSFRTFTVVDTKRTRPKMIFVLNSLNTDSQVLVLTMTHLDQLSILYFIQKLKIWSLLKKYQLYFSRENCLLLFYHLIYITNDVYLDMFLHRNSERYLLVHYLRRKHKYIKYVKKRQGSFNDFCAKHTPCATLIYCTWLI